MDKILSKAKSGIENSLDKESQTLFRNSSWVFLSNFTGIGLNVIRSIVIARGLGADTFGAYAIVVAFTGIVQEFVNLNLGTAVIKFGAAFQGEGRNDKLAALVKLSLKLSAIMLLISIAVICALTFLSYNFFVPRPGLQLFIILYAIASGSRYFNSISTGLLRLFYRFRLNSIITIIMDLVETVLVVLAVFFYPANLDVFFLTIIATIFLNGIICNVMAFIEVRGQLGDLWHAGTDLISKEISAIRTFIISNSLGNSLKAVMAQGDVLLLGILAGPTQVAFYAIAKKIGYAFLALTDPLMQSIFPQFSKLLAEHKHAETRKMLKKITLLALLPAIGFTVVTLFLREWLFTTVFGTQYLESIHPFVFLLFSAVFSAVTFWSLPLIVSLGLVKLRVKVYVIAILAGSLIAYFAIPAMHASGMALALLCMNIIINSIFIYFALMKMKVKHAPATA